MNSIHGAIKREAKIDHEKAPFHEPQIKSVIVCRRRWKCYTKRVLYPTPTPRLIRPLSGQNREDLSQRSDGRIVLYIS